MELRDFIVTPILLILIYVVAYFVRPYVTDSINRKYFFPALSVRILGALAVGFIYQFYYHGGDTFAYHTHGSRPIWEEIMASPGNTFRFLFSNGQYGPGLWDVAERVWYWRDHHSFAVIRIAAILDLFTFSTYSATASLFAVISFAGGWLLFITFCKIIPGRTRLCAYACLFVPSVVFWGSGLLKDTITLAALSLITYGSYYVITTKRLTIALAVGMFISAWLLYQIKVYILLCFLPALLAWWSAIQIGHIRSFMLKIMLTPFLLLVGIALGYFAIRQVAQDSKYDLANLAQTARITAYDIRYGWGARHGEGSGYTLGELDGSWFSMVKLAPQAINVSLFRPYLWEAKNPLMILSAIESVACLLISVYLLLRVRLAVFRYFTKPEILFCFVFSFIFAFAVGVSTYNFGTLSRYKIPMMPYFFMMLVLFYHYWNKDRKRASFASTE